MKSHETVPRLMPLDPPVAWSNPRNTTRATDRISEVCENGNERIELPLSYVAALIDSSLLPVTIRDDLTEQVINHLNGHDPEQQAWLEEIAKSCVCCLVCAEIPCPGVMAGGLCDEACQCDPAAGFDYG